MCRQLFTLPLSFCVALLLSMSVLPGGLKAQIGTASLNGTVTDPSGAVVPGAQVTVESTTRNATRKTVTDSAGNYVIPSLLPDSYRLVVAAKGFKTQTITGIELNSGQGSTLNVKMQLGAALSEVTVTEHAPLLQSTTATLGSQISNIQMASLPLPSRNYTSLLSLLPGASAPNLSYFQDFSPAGGSAADTSFYGQKPRDNEFLLDGIPNAEYLFNGVPIYPPPEAIEEMKVQSGMDSVAYGWASGANINVVTKSGTNAYHGSLWEYVQNDAFNARSFFSPSVGTLRYNQFGGAAGGPLTIPHILSKSRGWYIFGWYEGIRNPSGGPYYSLVPTEAEYNGDFSPADNNNLPIPQLYNPYTTVLNSDGSVASRAPFVNNQIPIGPTTACSPNPTCIDPNAIRIAKGLSPPANLTYPNLGPGNTNFIGHSTGYNNYNQWSARVDHQFGTKDGFLGRFTDARRSFGSSNGFNGIGNVNYQHFTNAVVSDTHTFSPTFLLTARWGWQRINWNNHTTGPELADPAGTYNAFPISFGGQHVIPQLNINGFGSYSQGWAYYGPENLLVWTVDAQKIIGNHMLQFGGVYTHDHFITDNQSGTTVTFSTTQTAAPNGAGGYGLASFFLGLPSDAGRVIGSTEGNMVGNYPSLYAQDTWHATKKLTMNLGVRWDPQITMKSQIGSGTFVWETGQYVFDRTNPITKQPANAQYGLIPSDWNNVAPRIGLAYSIGPKTVVRASYGIFYDVLGETAQDQQGNRGNWPFAFPQSVAGLNSGMPEFYFENPFPGAAQGSSTPLGCVQCLEVWPSATRTPYVQQWTISVQHQLTHSLMLQTAYFGSHGIDMSGQIVDNTAVVPGTGPFQERQRWPQFPPYVNNGFNQFPSYYDGLSVELRKQYSHSLAFLVSYTWSKAIDVSDSLIASNFYPFIQPTRFDQNLLRGPAGYNVTQRLSASYVWNIPIKTGSRLADAVVAGWNFSGIFTADSGIPFFPVLESDNANVGSVGGRATSLPNLVGNPVSSNPTINEWFNTSAYVIPPFGTQGDAGKHALYSDGLATFDASLAKSWHVKEHVSLEARGDFFNAFNVHQFGIPGFVVDSPTNFGVVSSTRQGGRTLQVSLEFQF